MSNWDGIKLEVEEFIIKDEPVDTVDELKEEESKERKVEGLEVAIIDTANIKKENVDESEQQEFQAACSSYEREIDQQLKAEDSSILQEQGSGPQFQCKICLKVFAKKPYLKQHIKSVHEGKKQLKCTVCGKGFVRKGDLKHHMYTHKPFKCTVCGEEFLWLSKNAQCTKCEKQFLWKSNLIQHPRIHDNKKEFKCAECGKAFLWLSTFKRHMVTHENRKKFNTQNVQNIFCGKTISKNT